MSTIERVYGPTLYRGRRFVTIERSDGSKCSMTYARWLMQRHLGRKLAPDEQVHHIDENPLNDVIANYQIVLIGDHSRLHRGETEMVTIVCPQCGSSATKLARHVRHSARQGKAGPFCGRSCAGSYGRGPVL